LSNQPGASLARDLLWKLAAHLECIDLQASTRRVAAEIQRYCAFHPNARDTIEGITWWVTLQRQHEMRSAVAEAVRVLVERGMLERFELQDGSQVFGCTCQRRSAGRRQRRQSASDN
jgi:hypothetical protein